MNLKLGVYIIIYGFPGKYKIIYELNTDYNLVNNYI